MKGDPVEFFHFPSAVRQNKEPSVRRRVLINLKKKYKTMDEAEAALGITVESYIEGSPVASSLPQAAHHMI